MLIGEVEKNSQERMRVSIAEFKGHKFIDLRVYYRDTEGMWKLTSKGVAMTAGSIDQIVSLLIQPRLKLGTNTMKLDCRRIDGEPRTWVLLRGSTVRDTKGAGNG